MNTNLQKHHHAAHKHYTQKTIGQGQKPKHWTDLTQQEQHHALQDLTDLINKTQKPQPPITTDTLHTINYNLPNFEKWLQTELTNAKTKTPKPHKKKNNSPHSPQKQVLPQAQPSKTPKKSPPVPRKNTEALSPAPEPPHARTRRKPKEKLGDICP